MDHLAALERLDRIVVAFASMVSHETRTALVGVQGLSELIRDGDLTEAEMRACADDIFTEARRMDNLIGEMFDLHRLEAEQAPFRRVRVDLNEIVRESAGDASARSKDVRFELNVAAAEAFVHGDPDRLRQAVDKIIGFCMRTMSAGGRIWVGTAVGESDVRTTIGSNALTAAGFDDWLYGRYERYEERPSAIIGAGLGLAIARAIVELHGGQIIAVRKTAKASEFQVMLPIA